MILKVFLFWRLGLLLVVLLASLTIARTQSTNINLITSWAQWDGGHYLEIAEYGYKSLEDYAFFPLYPLLIKLFSPLFLGNLTFSGLFISHTSFVLFLYFFYTLVASRYTEKLALSTIINFLVFPTAFFGVALYSESLFLLLTILSFYFLQKKHYLMASILASAASLTRLVGIVLIISIFYSYLSSRRFKYKKLDKDLFKIFVAPLGFFIYSIYLLVTTGDIIHYLSAQVYWQRYLANPFTTIFNYIWELFTLNHRPWYHYLDFLATIVFLLILVLGKRKIPSSWWIFSVLVILFPASTTSLVSMSRFALSSFGVFVIAGKFLEQKPGFKMPVWGFLLAVQAFLVVRFASGIWTA